MFGNENNCAPDVGDIRIFLVDDHPVVRFGLQKLLENEKDFLVVGDADCCQQCLDRIEQTRPDILILDLDLGDACGSEAVATIRAQFPDLPIVVYSGAHSQELIAEVVQQGAISYVLKDSSALCLFEAVRSAVQQQTYLDPVVTKTLLGKLLQSSSETSPSELLTDRESTVLVLLSQGLSNKEIARPLFISERTVKFHISAILEKLQAKNRTHAVRIAEQRGILPPPALAS